MKKKIIISIFLISFVFLLTGCRNKEADFKLQIKESSWSGWSANYKPEEVTNEYDIVLGKEYIIDSDSFIFKIKKINSKSIIIETKDAFSDSEDGIDLNTKKKKFEVFLDKEIKLTTPTMDEGKIYYLKLVKST
jgi:hypothetical protein